MKKEFSNNHLTSEEIHLMVKNQKPVPLDDLLQHAINNFGLFGGDVARLILDTWRSAELIGLKQADKILDDMHDRLSKIK